MRSKLWHGGIRFEIDAETEAQAEEIQRGVAHAASRYLGVICADADEPVELDPSCYEE